MGQKNRKKGFDYSNFETEALSGLRSGKGLVGSEGILKDLIQHLVESALDGEMTAHLAEEKKQARSNRRNGSGKKKIRTQLGEVKIHPPRDRNGSFEPQLIGKWDRKLNTGLEEQILELYSIGNSYLDIQAHIQKLYGVALSTGQLSAITDKVWDDITKWQKRALKSFYILIYLDAIHFKVRENGVVITKAVYTVYGVDADGYRDVLAIVVGAEEGAKQWGRILDHLKDRGVEDVLFFAIDGLTGFKEAIYQVFPQSTVQRCIVHMIRSSTKFVDHKDFRQVVKDLKAIYTADDEAQGLQQLDNFEATWDEKYPEISKAWRNNWIELTAFFGYNWAVRKLIYTTNAIEGLHRMMRKTTKTKSALVNEKALTKLLYLTLMRKQKVWKRRIRSYKAIQRSLSREFGERFSKHFEK